MAYRPPSTQRSPHVHPTFTPRSPHVHPAQDIFIREHITEDDFLIVSVGGNDVALSPTLRTAVNMFMLTRSPPALIKAGLAPGFGYFVKLFHGKIQDIIRRVVAKRKPKMVLVCMIYFLDELAGGSWADHTLASLGYVYTCQSSGCLLPWYLYK